MQDKLTNHLISVSNEAINKVDSLIEKNKENTPLEWVRLMNNYKNMAEEVVLHELIYN